MSFHYVLDNESKALYVCVCVCHTVSSLISSRFFPLFFMYAFSCSYCTLCCTIRVAFGRRESVSYKKTKLTSTFLFCTFCFFLFRFVFSLICKRLSSPMEPTQIYTRFDISRARHSFIFIDHIHIYEYRRKCTLHILCSAYCALRSILFWK